MRKTPISNTSCEDKSTLIIEITSLAALLHDIGKALKTFQQKLTGRNPAGNDAMRHERLSCAALFSLYCTMGVDW